MATKTITLTGAEVAVTGLDGAHAHIRNDGTEVIYAAKTADITAGADGVASIPAGQSDTIRGISGAVYLLGTGSVLIQSDDYVASPFKTSAASGGSAVDEVARAAVNTHAGNAEIHVTAEEKAAWNAVNYSNSNLMINADFRINQRGKSEYTGSGYTVDRWSVNGGVLVLADDGVTITNNGTSTVRFRQNMELKYSAVAGRKVTLSACSNGTVYTQSGIIPETRPTENDVAIINLKAGDCSINFNYSPSSDMFYAYAAIPQELSINLSWGKLEFGSVATPFTPPDPAAELAKCQRYYQIRSTGDIAAADLRPTMRDTPTITQLSDGNYAYSAEL